MAEMTRINVRVLGGLPLIAEVEIDGLSITDLQLTDRNGRRADWAENRMTPDGWLDLENELIGLI